MVYASVDELLARERPFFDYLQRWYRTLPALDHATDVKDPALAAIVAVDVTIGFCYRGNLASPRVATIVDPIVALFQCLHSAGVRQFLLLQDTHSPETPEFQTWPPHAVEGTEESQTVPELLALPFAKEYTLVPKNSLMPNIASRFDEWLGERAQVRDFFVVGDCTDLCVYLLAMYLRAHANAFDLAGRRVIVPANCVQTYDLPVDAAAKAGAFPHPGDFLHLLFLYHMALSGCLVVREVA